jgi:predicted amidohydrolase YtcJ
MSERPLSHVRVALALLLVPLGALAVRSQAPPADLVLTNGTVITVDAHDSVAQAVAVRDAKIVFVGSSAGAKRLIGERTEVVDLRGRTATPGLIDTHVHFSEAADRLDLGDANSIDEVIARVRAWAARLEPGAWVRGVGWDEGKLAERRYITAADLDKASPDRPVYLTHTTGHYGVANSLALKMSGVTRETKDPPGGTIDRDRDGNPTGVLKEKATGLVRSGGAGARGDMRGDVVRIIEGFNREGMTGAKDPGVTQGKWDLYKQLLDEGRLTVRVFALWRGGSTVQSAQQAMASMKALPRPPGSLGDGRLISGGVKLYIDGSGGGRTAWMYDDWSRDYTGTDAGNKGYPANGPDYPAVFTEQVRMLTEAGIHVATHAVGDRGMDYVVDTYAAAVKAFRARGLRHSIIHANTPTDHAIATMAALQRDWDAGYPEAQPTFLWWIGDTYAGNLGPARCPRLEPFRTYVRRGVVWSGGSDYNVTPYAARYGLWASVVRRTQAAAYGATPFGTAESVDIRTALKSYTIWAAHQLFLESRVGSLEVGKDADIAVWDRNMYTIPADDLRNLKCEMTFVAGKVVYAMAK